jgi:2-amino-4-hydroxy-6-hydroxymethyldihydropteridine diphosphokinase
VNEEIFLALGTNLGDREENLRIAKESLAPLVFLVKESSIYRTPPWGYIDQPDFLNQVIQVRSDLEPLHLLRYLKHIEKTMGREETFRNGPRLIDIDILFFGQRILKADVLCIPHPRLHERAFVLVPLVEITPEFEHPILKKSVRTLLAYVDAEGVQRV